MPWKECHIVEERLRFIARLLDGEKMAGLVWEAWDAGLIPDELATIAWSTMAATGGD